MQAVISILVVSDGSEWAARVYMENHRPDNLILITDFTEQPNLKYLA